MHDDLTSMFLAAGSVTLVVFVLLLIAAETSLTPFVDMMMLCPMNFEHYSASGRVRRKKLH